MRTIVAGPPCAGKSSYVREHMSRGDLVYDYDTLHGALSGQPSHQHDKGIRPYVLAARDAVLKLAAEHPHYPAWVITSSPKTAELERLQETLGGEVVLLWVDRDECHRRCTVDQRPEEWHAYIDNWFDGTDINADEWPLKSARRSGRGGMKHKSFRQASFKALDAAQGIFEAIVAVFNNVDRAGDKILPGAFKDSLADWEAKGRPIPVIFSHEWDNLDAHIGQVLEAKEVDEGLYVKGQLEMDEPFAQRVWKKMQKGTLAEFSFAYDVVDALWAKEDGQTIYELRKLDLLEVGPCLVGMNPETQLLGVKEGRRNSTKDADRIQAIHDLCVELGAKCAEPESDGEREGGAEDEAGTSGKLSGPRPSTLAARIALDLLEAGITA